MTEALRNKINAYIEWLRQQTNSTGYLDPLYQYQIEAFEEVLGWMDELPPEPDTLPQWVIDAIENEVGQNLNKRSQLFYCGFVQALNWVLSLRKPEVRE